MNPPRLPAACVAFVAFLGFAAAAWPATSPDQPTHKEIAPLRFPIGKDGRLKTIAMDARGNLLVGVSWERGSAAAPGAAPAPAGAPSATPPAETLARLRRAIAENTAAGWESLQKDVTPESFRAAMQTAPPEARREIVPRLPEPVRRRYLQPGGPVPAARPGAPPAYPGPGGRETTDFVLNPSGHEYALKVVSQEGQVLATWPMPGSLQPKMLFGHPDGTVYVAGGGRLARFSAEGRLLKLVDTDAIYGQKAAASGLCADDRHVFLAFGMGNSLRATEDIFRFTLDLAEPKQIVERQFGCCSHIDLRVVNGELLIAENSRHRVNRFDLDGKQLGTWGRRDRENLAGFAACCNPCNFDLGRDGVLYTAESGVGRVKKYAPDGRFLGLVGHVDTTKFDQGSQLAAVSCYIPIEVNHDASRIYVMDVRAQIIRVLAPAP